MAHKPVSASHGEVYSITAARRPHQDDVNERMLRYLVSMSIRTVCFVLVLVTPDPWRWFFAVGAIVLPYVAVIIANAGRERRGTAPEVVVPPPAAPQRLALGEAPIIIQAPAAAAARPAAASVATAGHPR